MTLCNYKPGLEYKPPSNSSSWERDPTGNIGRFNAVLVTESSNKEHMKHFHVSLPPDEVMGGKVAGFYSFDRIRPNLTNVHARQT